MTHTYKVSGMTCTGCQAKVYGVLSQIPGVTSINVDLAKGEVDVEMKNHISTQTFKNALAQYPKYQIDEINSKAVAPAIEEEDAIKPWFVTYKPIFLIFCYILASSLIAGYAASGGFDLMKAMRIFMAGFFLTFSFFKMLNLSDFARSYAMYDVIARKFRTWGYVYAFTELFLGLSYAINFQPLLTNAITFVVMTVSIIGVLQSVLNKRRIQCACLGAIFNLPMSTVTIIEDALMIVMSAVTMIYLLQ